MTLSRVLIADNDSRLRSQLYTRLLDMEVFSDCASNASEGFQYLAERIYGLVLLDLDLPNGEGYALLDRIRTFTARRRPMVLVTASREVRGPIDADTVQIIMRKPLRLADVADMIRSCLDSRSEAMARIQNGASRDVDLRGGDENPVGVVG